MNREQIKAALAEILALTDWTQLRLAEELEASESAVCRWMKGERLPNRTTRRVIGNLLATVRASAKQPA